MLIEIEVTRKYIGQEGHRKPGDKLFVSERRAQELIKHRLARLARRPGPQQVQALEPSEKKSFGAQTTTPSTALQSSSAPGLVKPQSASAAVLSSRPRSRRSRSGARAAAAAS